MTNEQIILNERIDLMESGLIGSTGRTLEVVTEDGEMVSIQEPEVIHTYAAWKKLGFQVRKGQKAVASFPIWKHTEKRAKDETEEDKEKMFMTTAFFFTIGQVDRVECEG